VVDYAKEDFTLARETYDIILDAVGNCSFDRCSLCSRPVAAAARRGQSGPIIEHWCGRRERSPR
jgi:hypothetical protein